MQNQLCKNTATSPKGQAAPKALVAVLVARRGLIDKNLIFRFLSISPLLKPPLATASRFCGNAVGKAKDNFA